MIIKKIVLLNGPTAVNKTDLCNILVQDHNFTFCRIDAEFKSRVHRFFGEDLPPDYFKDVLDEPSNFFLGCTPTQAYTSLTTYYTHKNKKFMVDHVIDFIDNNDSELFIVEDVKYDWEARYLLDYYGRNAIVVRLYKTGIGWPTDKNWGYIDRISTKINTNDYRYANLYNKDDMNKMLEDFKFICNVAFGKDI